MARKSLVATVVGIAAVAAPSALADKGGIPHDGSNGQGRPATQQTAATAPQGKALAKGRAKAHAAPQAKAKGRAKPQTTGRAPAKGLAKPKTHGNSAAPHSTPPGPPAANTHAKAGKTTICHATGSATNPYVTITISNNAIPAHRRHQDGRDIIPAPAGGCPTGQETTQTPTEQQSSTSGTTSTATGTPATPPAAAGTQPAAATGTGQVLGETVTGSTSTPASGTPSGNGSVLGATASGSSPSASASPAATATRTSSSSGLPFTGTDAIVVAIIGLAALLVGLTMRRAAAIRSSRS